MCRKYSKSREIISTMALIITFSGTATALNVSGWSVIPLRIPIYRIIDARKGGKGPALERCENDRPPMADATCPVLQKQHQV